MTGSTSAVGTNGSHGLDPPPASGFAATPGAGSDRLPVRVSFLVIVLSLLVGAVAVARTAGSFTSSADSDLATFFLKSAAYVARGDPWHMYAVRAAAPYTAYPNDNPPLSIVLMAPLLHLARVLGLARDYRTEVAFVSLFFVPLLPLLGGLVDVTPRRVRPAVPATTRLVAFALVALAPLGWLCVAPWGHLEQPLMLCFLVAAVSALQARHEALAGVLAGLAVLAGTIAVFPLAALVALLVASRQWRSAIRVGGLTAAVVALGMAPFLVADRHDVVYSFVTWRGGAQIGGNSIWDVFSLGPVARVMPHVLAAAVRRLDTPAMLTLAVVAAVLAARRLRVPADGPDVWAVLVIAALGLPLLSKVVWPYYYFQPFVLLLIYECGTLHRRPAGSWRWPALTVGFLVVATTLAQYISLRSTGPLDRVGAGVLECGAMLAVVLATWHHLRALAGPRWQEAGEGGGRQA